MITDTTNRIMITLDQDTLQRLNKLSEKNGLTKSSILKLLVNNYLND